MNYNYKISIEYIGTKYSGWQKQKKLITVQGQLEKILSIICGEAITINGAGRTDAGVHALGQIANFKTKKLMTSHRLLMAINAHLRMNNDHIRVINSEIVDDSFHARFSAQKRYYQYIILNAENESPFWLNRALHIYGKLDLEKMQQAARCLIGKHDFTSLRATHCQAKSPIITLDNIEIVQQEQLFFINIKARSFLHHMVRNITGLLINVGQDKLQINEVKRIIDAKDRKVAPATVKPWGLYFMKVDY